MESINLFKFRNIRTVVYFLSSVCIFFLAVDSCSTKSIAGAGSETTNSLTGKLTRFGGPASSTIVRLLPSDFDCVADAKSRILLDTTNDLGVYKFDGVDTGTYTIEAVGIAVKDRACKYGFHVVSNDTLSTDTLHAPGTIKIPVFNTFDKQYGYVYIPGTTNAAFITEGEDTITLDSVASGLVPLVSYSSTRNNTSASVVRSDIVLPSNGVAIINQQGMQYQQKIVLNTSASGANVAGDVVGFPVLVRLSASDFNFSLSQKSGGDVKFTKSSGAPLPFQIELWDSAAKQAAVWVNVDTVLGNNSSQYIVMNWGLAGNTNAIPLSLGQVFDTLAGFLGVWHQGPGLEDGTVYGDNGIDSATADAAGIIGRCRSFNPLQRSFISIPTAPRFNMTTNITLSAWIKVDSIAMDWKAIIAKGDDTYRLQCDSANKTGYFNLTDSDTVNHGYEDLEGSTKVDDQTWHLVVGTFDGSVMRLYIDGVLESSRPGSKPCLVNNLNLTIGNNQQRTSRFFAGMIDEVRVMNKTMNADWVKLCFMNQKSNDALVVFQQ